MTKLGHPHSREFETEYWSTVYSNLDSMDAISNAHLHADSIASSLALINQPVLKLADFGCGFGFLAKEVSRRLKPRRLFLMDKSRFAVETIRKKTWHRRYDTRIIEGDICTTPTGDWQLGLFNSIAQYLDDRELKDVMEKLAGSCRYLYFSVPTRADYDEMYRHSGFSDPWAFQRPVSFYRRLIGRYFTVTSFRLLESKVLVNPRDSHFDDELFRINF